MDNDDLKGFRCERTWSVNASFVMVAMSGKKLGEFVVKGLKSTETGDTEGVRSMKMSRLTCRCDGNRYWWSG